MKHHSLATRILLFSLLLLTGISLIAPAAVHAASDDVEKPGSYVFAELTGDLPDMTREMLTTTLRSYSMDFEDDILTIYIPGYEPQKAALELAGEDIVPPGLDVAPCSLYTVAGDVQTVSYYISGEYLYYDLMETMSGFITSDGPVYAVFHKDPAAEPSNLSDLLASSLLGGGKDASGEKAKDAPDAETAAETSPEDRIFTEADLLGDWVNIESLNTLTLSSSSISSFTAGSTTTFINDWSVSENTLFLNQALNQVLFVNSGLESKLKITEKDGVISLNSEDGSLCFMRPDALPIPLVSLKETASGELLDITVDSVELLWDMPSDLKYEFRYHKDSMTDHSPRVDGQVLVKLSFRIFNKSKAALELPGFVPELLRITLEYADGYQFTTDGSNGPVYFTDGTNYYCRATAGYGSQLSISPLQEKSITVYLRCPEIVGKNPDAGLDVVVLSLHDADKAFYFRCHLLGESQADGAAEETVPEDDAARAEEPEAGEEASGIPEDSVLALGDTAVTDQAEVKLTGLKFMTGINKTDGHSDQLDKAYNLGTRYSLTPPDGKVFCAVMLRYTNKTQEKPVINDTIRTSVRYNDQIFSDSDKTVYWISEDGAYYSGDTGKGYTIRMNPGMTGTFRVFIPVAATAKDNYNAPFNVELTLPSSEGNRLFSYEIDRAKENNTIVLSDDPVVPYREYTNKTIVRQVQTALNNAGFNCGTPDGVSGNKTVEAIKAYQKEKGLDVNGKLDTILLESLGTLYYPGTRIIRAGFVSAYDVSAYLVGEDEVTEEGIISQSYFIEMIKEGKDPYRCEPFGFDNGFIYYMEENFHSTEPSAAEKISLHNLLKKSSYSISDSNLVRYFKITETGDLVGVTYGHYGTWRTVAGVKMKDVEGTHVVIIPGSGTVD